MKYLGEKLSLWVYIFHVHMSIVISHVCSKIFKVDIQSTLFSWCFPIITVVVVVIFCIYLRRQFKKLKDCKYVRQHLVDHAALIIATPMPWNSEPFMCSVLVSYNAATVITEDKTTFLTYGTNKIVVDVRLAVRFVQSVQ